MPTLRAVEDLTISYHLSVNLQDMIFQFFYISGFIPYLYSQSNVTYIVRSRMQVRYNL